MNILQTVKNVASSMAYGIIASQTTRRVKAKLVSILSKQDDQIPAKVMESTFGDVAIPVIIGTGLDAISKNEHVQNLASTFVSEGVFSAGNAAVNYVVDKAIPKLTGKIRVKELK